ncbi:uncharacterized protein [Symphalangus syndactylus]|uniref:uncharacterized protein isoform X2 n=1 Tax=Symphalangus syndactylus TaxID=9590 RepID=UPI0030070448
MPDNRVQCCLSFIVPSGHGLTPLDIEFMKCLHEKVNIIPLIAKADTLTPEECQQFKKQSLQYCLGTSGNSKPRPHMKKTGKGFVTMENTCRAKGPMQKKKWLCRQRGRETKEEEFEDAREHSTMDPILLVDETVSQASRWQVDLRPAVWLAREGKPRVTVSFGLAFSATFAGHSLKVLEIVMLNTASLFLPDIHSPNTDRQRQ